MASKSFSRLTGRELVDFKRTLQRAIANEQIKLWNEDSATADERLISSMDLVLEGEPGDGTEMLEVYLKPLAVSEVNGKTERREADTQEVSNNA